MEISTTHQEESQEQENTPGRRRLFRDYITLLLGTGLIVALDQYTKSLVLKHVPFLDSWLPDNLSWLAPYARIVHWRNSGAAFGFFQNGNMIFIIMAFLATIFILVYYPIIGKEERVLRFAMILQLGGALGNLIDRLKFGYVIDFLSVGNFPVFNVADSSITIGVTVLLISIVLEEFKGQKANTQNIEPSVSEANRQIENS